MSRTDIQTNLRLPVELKDWLKRQATVKRRSFASEVVTRLEEAEDYQRHIGEKRVDSHFSRSKDRGKVSPVSSEASTLVPVKASIENPNS